jgi:hypothetical protein
MLCFQDHIAAIPLGAGLEEATAKSLFTFLPAGGFLPVGDNGFDARTFLGETAVQAPSPDFGRLRALVEESWLCDPIELGDRLPPLVYFAFTEAGGQWVFFMRGRPESAPATPPPQAPGGSPPGGSTGSPPETPGGSGESGTSTPPAPPQPAAPKAPVGTVLVIVPASWEAKDRDLELFLDAEPLSRLDAEEAIALAKRQDATTRGNALEQEALAKIIGGVTKKKKPKPDAKDLARFKGASFFFKLEVSEGSHWLYVGAEDSPTKHAKPLPVTVEANQVNLVPLS